MAARAFHWLRKPPRPGGVREVWRVAAPIIISMVSFTLMQFFDRIFLAHHSSVGLRAALPAGILSFTLTAFFQSLAGFASTFVAQYHGAGRREECSRVTAQGVWLGFLTWPLCIAVIPLGFWFLTIAGHPPDVLAAEKTYLGILMLGGGIWSVQNALAGFFSGRGDTGTPMRANIVGNLANVVLNYALIFGHWGFPAMGIAGAAIATVASSIITWAILLAYYLRARFRIEYGTLRNWRLEWPLMGPLLRFGVPAALQTLQDVGAFTFFVVLLGRLAPADMAASNIAFSINNLAFMPLLGMGMATTIVVGQYQGARDSATAARAGISAMKIAWIYMGIMALSFLLFPQAYFALFTGDGPDKVALSDVMDTGRWLMLMLAGWGFLDAISLVLAGALKGAGDTRFVLIASTIATWAIWIPGELILLLWFDAGLMAAWLYMSVFVLLLATIFGWRFWRGSWKNITMIPPKDPANKPPKQTLK